ncbi:glycosyltransferase family 2 protein [Gymnodinialimonas ulvae]|uniref:glycosyltransferase family 2 protein n=1 Tax=Gymnodinialimonas ulvae TaxID=3126504 RepID=UPI0030ACFAC0
MSGFTSEVLEQVTPGRPKDVATVACVTVCHNEAVILPHFLHHYRGIGCNHFFIVDDHSTDGTFEILSEQSDITLFRPAKNTSYRENLGKWREDILDYYCTDRWVTLPDLDEFLYYKEMPMKLCDLAQALEDKGERALLSVMIDMYADMPLDQHHFDGRSAPHEAFPYFDDQGAPPFGIRIMSQPTRFLKRFPTPHVCFMGGVRDRLFFWRKKPTALQTWFLGSFAHIKRPLNPSLFENLQNRLTRLVMKNALTSAPSVLNKFALLKWPKGAKFARGPHSIDKKVAVSEHLAASLHYKFYKGREGLSYSVGRGQHAGKSALSKLILADNCENGQSPVFEGSKRFEGVKSLSKLLK